jgi:hypothetical protein
LHAVEAIYRRHRLRRIAHSPAVRGRAEVLAVQKEMILLKKCLGREGVSALKALRETATAIGVLLSSSSFSSRPPSQA